MITRLQYDDLRRRVHLTAPTRARAVLQLIDSVELPETPNRRQRRQQQAKKQQHRHPGRPTARERRKHWHEPDSEEEETREINRLVRKHRERMPKSDGPARGLFGAIAEFHTSQLLVDFGFDESHGPPFQHWLIWKFGDVLRDPDPQGYLAWRESCQRAMAG